MLIAATIFVFGMGAVLLAWRLEYVRHLARFEATRMRGFRDEQATEALRVQLAAENMRVARARLQRIVDAYHCDRAPVSFGPQLAANDATTMALREVA